MGSFYNIKKGFTLVEMLIVIVIIGILAAALIPRLTGAQAQARDAARMTDLTQLGTALMAYNADNGSYPVEVAVTRNATDALSGMIPTYIKSIPTDPQFTTTVGFCSADNVGTTTTGSYGYLRLAGNANFVLIANTQVSKKGNWMPTGGGGTGCIGTWVSFSTVLSYMINGANVTNNQGTKYIYVN